MQNFLGPVRSFSAQNYDRMTRNRHASEENAHLCDEKTVKHRSVSPKADV